MTLYSVQPACRIDLKSVGEGDIGMLCALQRPRPAAAPRRRRPAPRKIMKISSVPVTPGRQNNFLRAYCGG
jgi:hypothetical protein